MLREIRWRLRRARPQLRKPVTAWRHRALSGDDAMLASYPRSGSNWLSLMLGEALAGTEVDFETDPFPIGWISRIAAAPRLLPGGGRMIKTHEPWSPAYDKTLFIHRHPLEVAESYYRWAIEMGLPRLSESAFVAAWTRGELDGYGRWDAHLASWLDRPGVLMIRYDDLRERTVDTLELALRHLGVQADREFLATAAKHNTRDRYYAKQQAIWTFTRDPPELGSGAAADVQAAVASTMDRLGYEVRVSKRR